MCLSFFREHYFHHQPSSSLPRHHITLHHTETIKFGFKFYLKKKEENWRNNNCKSAHMYKTISIINQSSLEIARQSMKHAEEKKNKSAITLQT